MQIVLRTTDGRYVGIENDKPAGLVTGIGDAAVFAVAFEDGRLMLQPPLDATPRDRFGCPVALVPVPVSASIRES